MNRIKIEERDYKNKIRERIDMKKGFSEDNNGLSSFEPANFAKYIDWLENRLFEAHNEIERIKNFNVSGNNFAVKADLNLELIGTVDFKKQKITFDNIIAKSKLK